MSGTPEEWAKYRQRLKAVEGENYGGPPICSPDEVEFWGVCYSRKEIEERKKSSKKAIEDQKKSGSALPVIIGVGAAIALVLMVVKRK
jgi:hypothetical protein